MSVCLSVCLCGYVTTLKGWYNDPVPLQSFFFFFFLKMAVKTQLSWAPLTHTDWNSLLVKAK